ncbi:hypothetical protein LJY25_08320 [Hymenobacter sp. BT175]|uniref:hypothetical protein n=1 Tax=Hymenobacter translucens TaxID=2886507 RepID=UPI001D0F42C3|nr:hypothetical protein [Hymenobacter translucens]MCC2546446.1 hypothetical protein [Hymenobacter translucens]
MEPNNRLAEIFADLGVSEMRLSKEQLDKWGMTPNRFNQLVANKARVGMTVGEADCIREWLQKNFKGRNACLFERELGEGPVSTSGQRALFPG